MQILHIVSFVMRFHCCELNSELLYSNAVRHLLLLFYLPLVKVVLAQWTFHSV